MDDSKARVMITLPEKPQALKRHRHTKHGHVYNPSIKEQKLFHNRSLKFSPPFPIEGSVAIFCWFTFERPKIHYRTGKFSDQLKENVPFWHIIKPDLSNLIKFYEDALGLSDHFFLDDKQICFAGGVKYYGSEPEVRIAINEIR
tara:strand:+ start:477 stop:908 length:432 start_codon:yes stop_codon:yes gene_type:complete